MRKNCNYLARMTEYCKLRKALYNISSSDDFFDESVIIIASMPREWHASEPREGPKIVTIYSCSIIKLTVMYLAKDSVSNIDYRLSRLCHTSSYYKTYQLFVALTYLLLDKSS